MGDELNSLRTAIESARKHLDCGDSACMFALTKGGMRTNGGCRCIEPGTAYGVAPSLAAVWKAAIAVSDLMTWRPLATLDTTSEREVLTVAPHGGFQGAADYRVRGARCVHLGLDSFDHERNATHWMSIPEFKQ